MFDHQIQDQQQFNAKPLIETMIETSVIANNERSEAIRKVVGGWIDRLREISRKNAGFGASANG